jgi:hypothetical protein
MALILMSCFNDEHSIVVTTNKEFEVELLFEVDDCKVYRFFDGGSARYFSTCQGTVSGSEYRGKSGYIHYDIPTVIKP